MYVEQFTNNFCHLTKNKLSLLNNKHNLNIKKLYFFYNKIVEASKFAAILQKEIVGEFVELNNEQRNTLFTNEHLLNNSVYFSDKIKKNFEETSTDKITYTFTINDRKINVIFIRNNESCSKGKINVYIKQIILTIYLLLDLLETNITKSLKLIIILSEKEKQLPKEKNDILHSENVNSGLTYACTEHNQILLYREEELCKVLIHELIHAFCGDIYFNNFNFKIKNKLREIYFINSDIHVRETFCELMANLINSMIISYKVSDNNFQEFAYNFYVLNAYEKMFSVFQTVKILDYVNLTYNDITSNKFKSIKNYKEKTNVFAYYILKSLWLFFDDEFLSIFMKKNKFKKENYSSIVNKMLKLVKEKYNDGEFLNIIKINEKKLKKVKKNKDKYTQLHNSLRMTLFNIC